MMIFILHFPVVVFVNLSLDWVAVECINCTKACEILKCLWPIKDLNIWWISVWMSVILTDLKVFGNKKGIYISKCTFMNKLTKDTWSLNK